MRLALLITLTTVAGLGACAPIPGDPYGYAAPGSYGYYDGGYAPGPYYPEPGYATGYVVPRGAVIVGGERRWDGDRNRDRDRYRYERSRNEGGYRGNPNPSNRDYGRSAPQQSFGGNRPGPSPVAVSRPSPAPQGAPPPPPSGGAAFEQWNRTHVNSSPAVGVDSGGR